MNNNLIMPSSSIRTQLEAATAKVQAKLDETYNQRIRVLEDEIAGLKIRLEYERRYGAVARAVMGALRRKGAEMPHTPPDPGVSDVCIKYAEMGKDFDTMIELIKKDPFLISEWERLLLAFKMADDGGKNGEEE